MVVSSIGWLTPWLTSGTTYQRCHVPARLLAERGWQTAVRDTFVWGTDDRIRLSKDVQPKVGEKADPDRTFAPDVLVISWWAPKHGDPAPVLRGARRAGQRILLDVDDNPFARRGHADPTWLQLVRHCDGVLVTTTALAGQLTARWHGKPPVRVVPTMYDPGPYQWPAGRQRPSWGTLRGRTTKAEILWLERPMLGFRGGLQWHRTDAAELRRLRHLAPIVHIGHDPRRWACDCGKYVPYETRPDHAGRMPVCSCGQEMVDGIPTLEEICPGVTVARRFLMRTYPHYARLLGMIAPYITLGVIPLDGTNFAQAKTHIGGLEWAAVGVPWVATATAEYDRLGGRLSKHYLVRKPRDWPRLVGELLRDWELCDAVRAEQHERAVARTANVWPWVEILSGETRP